MAEKENIQIFEVNLEAVQQPEAYDAELNVELPQNIEASMQLEIPEINVIESDIKSISENGVVLPIDENGNVDVVVPTKVSELDNDEDFVSESDLAEVATSGSYDDLENKPDIEDIATNVASSAVSTHNESEDAHTDIRNEISTVKDIAEGANIAIVFDSYSDLVTFFNSESDSLKVGTNLYVKTVEVPDLWISAVESTSVAYTYTTDDDFLTYINGNGQIGYYKFSELETQKVDLSNYATLTDLGTKVSKSGDTMTGDLAVYNSAVVIKVSDTQMWRLKNNTTHLEVSYSTNGGTSWGVRSRWYATQDKFYFNYNNVYAGNTTEENRFLVHSEIDNPTTSTSVTLVGGITHFNALGSVDYATISLPANSGTAEYNGTFTSTTSGDIRNNTGLSSITKWQGDVTIEANATYSFCFQNGNGVIVKML